ncbi:MAG TPA: histidine phosphatase family protein [Gemmatimonadaceae bacterium]|nr:histidine phosphatase family protein [Gemmatimonadaceae bacterium]
MILSHSIRGAARIAVALILLSCTPQLGPSTEATGRGETIVYVVRHAEKAAENPSDPLLTPVGYARADSLASQLREAGINRIISSNRKRTILTAEPLAKRTNVEVEVIGLSSTVPEHAQDVASAIRLRPGARVVVVGHSNTVGPIIAALGGPTLGDLCDSEHSNLFILTIAPGGMVRMLRERYGPPDPPGDGKCIPMR